MRATSSTVGVVLKNHIIVRISCFDFGQNLESQCRSTTTGLLLIPHYNATTLPLRRTLGDKIDNAIQQKKQIQPNGWQNQAQYSFKILTTNIVIGVQSNSQEMAPSANASY